MLVFDCFLRRGVRARRQPQRERRLDDASHAHERLALVRVPLLLLQVVERLNLHEDVALRHVRASRRAAARSD